MLASDGLFSQRAGLRRQIIKRVEKEERNSPWRTWGLGPGACPLRAKDAGPFSSRLTPGTRPPPRPSLPTTPFATWPRPQEAGPAAPLQLLLRVNEPVKVGWGGCSPASMEGVTFPENACACVCVCVCVRARARARVQIDGKGRWWKGA